jgi:hypothetical protein
VSDPELDARTALVEYYASLMESYKTFILTFAIAIFTVIEVWYRIINLASESLWAGSLSIILGAILASILLSGWRWLWCGHIVDSAIHSNALDPKPQPQTNVLRTLDEHIKCYAGVLTNFFKRETKLNRLWMLFMRNGDEKEKLVVIWAILWGFFSFSIFLILFAWLIG